MSIINPALDAIIKLYRSTTAKMEKILFLQNQRISELEEEIEKLKIALQSQLQQRFGKKSEASPKDDEVIPPYNSPM